MGRTLILHDLRQSDAEQFLPRDSVKYSLFAAAPPVRHCAGCFLCWVKTPGRCVIPDRGADFAAIMTKHDELIFLSRLVFGGLSPDIKAVLDRSIGFVLPFFRKLNGETHHVRRYDKSPAFRYIFYGVDITDKEKETAKKLAAANALNFGSERFSVSFFSSIPESAETLL
ncbi:MAG: flavodoxin family protein [Clostridiales Family XIII bacterium]|jgi:multimeric flavodoxin WrbA|nr:flavodoxin family protein [Clostridiales Family XIII bacterium]